MVIGVIFVGIGVTMVIPHSGLPFGAIWTLMAVAITGFNAYNFFSQKGASFYEVDFETRENSPGNDDDFDSKLRKIDRLYKDGIITEEEYRTKREEVMREKW